MESRDLTEDRRRFLSIFEQVCQTIAYAHSRDVLHRDPKPSNIMVGACGEVQVVDWGLAKVLRRTGDPRDALSNDTHFSVIGTVRTGATTTASESIAGALMGTPAYMPPEQARGEIENLGVAAEVFTLGGLPCEILTGATPYPGPKEVVMGENQAADTRRSRFWGDSPPSLIPRRGVIRHTSYQSLINIDNVTILAP